MPAEYVDAQDTVQTIGEDISRNAERITWRAQPSGVVFSLLFAPWPSEIWTDSVIAQLKNEWADRWNENAAVPGVSAISVTQEQDDAGNLRDVAYVWIRSTSGNAVARSTFSLPEFWPDQFAQRVAKERATLDAIEG